MKNKKEHRHDNNDDNNNINEIIYDLHIQHSDKKAVTIVTLFIIYRLQVFLRQLYIVIFRYN